MNSLGMLLLSGACASLAGLLSKTAEPVYVICQADHRSVEVLKLDAIGQLAWLWNPQHRLWQPLCTRDGPRQRDDSTWAETCTLDAGKFSIEESMKAPRHARSFRRTIDGIKGEYFVHDFFESADSPEYKRDEVYVGHCMETKAPSL